MSVAPKVSVFDDLQFLNDRCHASIIGDLSLLIAALFDAIDTQPGNVATEDPRDKNTGPDLLLVRPFDFEHAPICLDSDGRQSLFLAMFFRFTKQQGRYVSRQQESPVGEKPNQQHK